jgi:hypothetical protein
MGDGLVPIIFPDAVKAAKRVGLAANESLKRGQRDADPSNGIIGNCQQGPHGVELYYKLRCMQLSCCALKRVQCTICELMCCVCNMVEEL